MKKFLAISLVLIGGVCAAQNTETRNIESFTGVKVSKAVSVYLKKGSKESAKVEVTGTDVDNVITEVSGSYLKVYLRGDGNYRNVTAKVYVTYVNVERLSASSAGNIFSQDVIKTNDIEISAASAGNIEVELDADRADVSSASAGEVELRGKVKNLTAEAASAGNVDAYDLEAANVEVRASSAGVAKISVTTALVANASTAGVVKYRGNPDKQVTTSSTGGSVKKSN